MAPKAFKHPFQQKPDLNTPAPSPVDDLVLETMKNIILEESPYAVVQRLSSGTVRRDRLTATEEERQAAKEEEAVRREQRCEAIGSNRADFPEPVKAKKPTKPTKPKVAAITIEPADEDEDGDGE